MNPEIKRLWTSALRSDLYQQGKTYLKFEDSGGVIRYCPLGVLCELHAFVTNKKWKRTSNVFTYLGNASLLPFDVVFWSGLENDNPCVNEINITILNDEYGFNFAYIANQIDMYL